jgi:serine/threonine-protein kinase
MNLLNNRYRVIRELGDGGFGKTYLAEDTQMPSLRCCVIKQLKPVNSNPQVDQLIQDRFAREAVVLEKLGDNSPQIPRLYAYFTEDNQFYLVQEWIEGITLTKQVQQFGHLSESSVREILKILLSVLDYVHTQGIVHRDIKPDNIILRASDGQPVLIDFGAVREIVTTELNSQGHGIMTLGFMPPEQGAGRPVYSSDLYSLGLTAIYLLTGKKPQELLTDPTTAEIGQIVWQKQGVSPILADVLDRAIRFHPRDRFPTAKAMLEALGSPAVSFPVRELTDTGTPYSSPPAISPSGYPTPSPTLYSPAPDFHTPPPKKSNSVIIGGLIAAGLIGGSILIGLILSQNSSKQSSQLLASPTPSSLPVIAETPPTASSLPATSPPVSSASGLLSLVFPRYVSNALPESEIPEFARCFNGETLYMVGETARSRFAICGIDENPLQTPTAYIGYDKRDGEVIRAEFRNNRFFKFDTDKNRLYEYDPPSHAQTSYDNPYIGVYRDGQLIQNVQILELYKRD